METTIALIMAQKKGVLKKKVEKSENKRKEKAPYEYESLDVKLQEKALLAAEAQIYKLNKDGLKNEPIFLQLSTLLPTSSSKKNTRQMIPIPNRLRSVKETSILLVTRDPVDTCRTPLSEKKAATTDTFAEIVGFKRFKSMVGTSKKALKTYHEYDLIMIDHILFRFLRKLLEPTIFSKSAQKYPLMVQMAKSYSSTTPQSVRDDRVDPDYVLSQVKAWCKNTTFVPSTGPSLSIVVGTSNMTGIQIVENIDAVLTFLTTKKVSQLGGVVRQGMNGVIDLYLRANDKAVPILRKEEKL